MRYSLKGCRRCGGDLYEDWDGRLGFYVSCLQCGRSPSPTEEMITAVSAGSAGPANGLSPLRSPVRIADS